MYFVYVLFSEKDRKLYIGYSSDLKQRIIAHQKGYVSATKKRRPLTLIYYEAYINKKDVKGREVFLKSGSGHRFLKKTTQ
jgi:putative endonuclease